MIKLDEEELRKRVKAKLEVDGTVNATRLSLEITATPEMIAGCLESLARDGLSVSVGTDHNPLTKAYQLALL